MVRDVSAAEHAGVADEHSLDTNLRRIREEVGLSQEELMGLSGVHRTQISEYERGKRVPKLITLERLARSLDVPLNRFFAAAEEVEDSAR